MIYGILMGFMYEVGTGVGEFISDEERDNYVQMSLPEIVSEYFDTHGIVSAFFLKRQIKSYIKRNMTADGLEYAEPFNQELRFPEDYFEGDLLVFLTNVLSLLDAEVKSRIKGYFSRK
ncbi:MAG TPA: hypothetical protein VGC62_01825 [Pseudomonas sp.]|uniref:hypothetical protein n=1 Tax=Pseudomonas sp. TaxID=306 RepID=UPI002ED9553F